jgi:hypothetical protein
MSGCNILNKEEQRMSRRLPHSLALGGLLALGAVLPAAAQETFYFRMNISPTAVEIPPTVVGLVSAGDATIPLDAAGAVEGTEVTQAQTLTFQNISDPPETVTISSVSITSGAANFSVTGGNCTGAILAPLDQCTVEVTFTATAGGNYSGVLTLFASN